MRMWPLLFLLSHSHLPPIFRNKVVADGAVSFCIGHFVADKFAFGTNCNVIYVLYNPKHVPRSADKYVNAIGKDQWIFWCYPSESISICRDDQIDHYQLHDLRIWLWMKLGSDVLSRAVCLIGSNSNFSRSFLIICYRGRQAYEEHSLVIMDKESSECIAYSSWFWHRAVHHFIEMYTTLCTVQGDTSNANIPSGTDNNSRTHYWFDYEAVLYLTLNY